MLFAENCPINECTGDGIYVGRCWSRCSDGICPRHGDVSKALEHYLETGRLTKEEPAWLKPSTSNTMTESE